MPTCKYRMFGIWIKLLRFSTARWNGRAATADISSMPDAVLDNHEVKALSTEILSGKVHKCSLQNSRFVGFISQSAGQHNPPWAFTCHESHDQEEAAAASMGSLDFEDAFICLSDTSNAISAKSQVSMMLQCFVMARSARFWIPPSRM